MTMASKNLLDEFAPVTTEQWEAVIRKDLKGADYAKKLLWQAEDGVTVKPYYREEDLEELAHLGSVPGQFPYVRGAKATADWKICEQIDAADAAAANGLAHAALAAGTEMVAFPASLARDRAELATLLKGLEHIPVHFAEAKKEVLEMLVSAGSTALCSADFDALSDLELAATLVKQAPLGLRPFAIRTSNYDESGATTVQEIGFTLAAGIDYLAGMTERGIAVDRAAESVLFAVSIGSNYFFQIANLRALRLLWAQAVVSFGGSAESAKAVIFARTSRWNKTLYDPHVNVLRGTTEAMSAAIGGADAILVAAFDEPYRRTDEASRALARNTQIVLKKEALLELVADPGGGAYYVEALTDRIARLGWQAMQRIEAAGGYRKAVADGVVAKELERSRAAAGAAVASRKRVFVGTNQYPNPDEKALDRLDPAWNPDAHRATAEFEAIRLRTERHAARGGKSPRFLLAEIGDAKMRAARSAFAANFFGCGGFEIVQQRFVSVGEIADADSDVIVLCSSDGEYPALVKELMAKLKSAKLERPVIVAGNPEAAAELKSAGVADFVHVRSNPLETLKAWQDRLRVKE
jgi:methylmalonyl-CoA mutase